MHSSRFNASFMNWSFVFSLFDLVSIFASHDFRYIHEKQLKNTISLKHKQPKESVIHSRAWQLIRDIVRAH